MILINLPILNFHISGKGKKSIMKCMTVFVVLYIILRFVLEVVDLGLDWDFYKEVADSDQESIIRAEKVKWTIFGFAVFGTVMFLITVIVFSLKIYTKRRKGKVSEEFYEKVNNVLSVLSCACIWLEDLPQIVLAVVVAVKSTELISDVQLVKAWYALAEAIIESTITLTIKLRPCCDNKPGGWRRALMILELIGNILILLVSAFLLIELYQDNFKEMYPQQNNATIFNNTTTTWTTPISST